jgi:hypothetical protein
LFCPFIDLRGICRGNLAVYKVADASNSGLKRQDSAKEHCKLQMSLKLFSYKPLLRAMATFHTAGSPL